METFEDYQNTKIDKEDYENEKINTDYWNWMDEKNENLEEDYDDWQKQQIDLQEGLNEKNN